MNTRTLITLVCFLLPACSRINTDISTKIEAEFNASQTAPIDLTVVLPTPWDRVCVLAPYRDNEQTEKILGFKWNSDSKTSIRGNDGINVLVFIQGSEVVAYTEHRRDKGDFSRMLPSCLMRDQAMVVRQTETTRDSSWVFLVANQ
nr:hypothetical protein [uncultured Rhodoferax sp.]